MSKELFALLSESSKTALAEPNDVTEKTVRRRRFSLRWEYVAVVLAILLISGIRFRLRDFPLERDEGEYAYAGQLILQGVPPYQLAYNMKLPGTYAAYAVILKVFGETPAGIHLGLIVVNSVSIVLLFLVVRRLFDPMAAVVASATFGLFTIRPLLLGIAAHATHFVVLFALLAIWIFLKAFDSDRLVLYFASGFCFGLAFLMKQPGIFFGIFGALYLCFKKWPAPDQRASFAGKLGGFSAGAVTPYVLTCLILWRAGVFSKFWFWTVSYARAYASELTAREGLRQFANRMELQKEHIGLIWFLIVFGLAAFLWDRKIRSHAPFMLGLLGFSFLAISVGLYFRGHYFIMIYPVLAILAGVGVSAGSSLLQRFAKVCWLAFAPPVLFVFIFANAVYADRETYFYDSPNDACRYVYGTNPFPEALEISEYIKEVASPQARLAVLGSEPEIYFYSQRRSATGYIYTYALVEEQKYGTVMQREMEREIDAVKPEFLVYVLMHESWNTRPRADTRIFDWIESYIAQNYVLEGVADGGNRDVYRWGADAMRYRPRRREYVLLYRRRP